MEANQSPSIKSQQFWTNDQIILSSIIAGPVGGCYLLGRNFNQLGQPGFAKKSYAAGLLLMIVVATIVFFIPEPIMAKIPKSFFPMGYTLIIASIAHVSQKNLIEEKLKEGNKRFSYWWCLLMTIALLIVQVPFIILYTICLATISA